MIHNWHDGLSGGQVRALLRAARSEDSHLRHVLADLEGRPAHSVVYYHDVAFCAGHLADLLRYERVARERNRG